jgi:SAM-dependent methyltransferase
LETNILSILEESNDQYVKTHKKRIQFTIDFAKKHNIINGNVVDIGGSHKEAVSKAWQITFPKSTIINTQTNLNDPLPYDNNVFDNSIFTEVFEHIGDRNFMSSHSNFKGIIKLLIEILRVMKPNGKCLLTTPNICSFKNIALALSNTHPFMYPLHYREYTQYEIKTLLNFVKAEIITFETHDIFGQNQILVELLKDFCKKESLSLDCRGNDFFIIFKKPDNWEIPIIPDNTAFLLYNNCQRENYGK